VRNDSALSDFSQLRGKRVGVDDYSMTAAVWLRGLLRSEYGVDHRGITWVTPRQQRFPLPPDANVEQVDTTEAGGSLEARLLAGSIDAALGFSFADAGRPAAERRLRTLLADPETAERAYYRATGLFPIHHCVVVRTDVLDRLPGLPRALLAAYEAAKTRAMEQRAQSLLPWPVHDWARDMAFFGGDPMPYGWSDVNRRNLATLARYLYEQGFVRDEPEVDRLFVSGAG
jgi:4,5-dihydroxyphthalate decarboxylase